MIFMLAKYSSFPKAELFINHQNSSNKIDLGGVFSKNKASMVFLQKEIPQSPHKTYKITFLFLITVDFMVLYPHSIQMWFSNNMDSAKWFLASNSLKYFVMK